MKNQTAGNVNCPGLLGVRTLRSRIQPLLTLSFRHRLLLDVIATIFDSLTKCMNVHLRRFLGQFFASTTFEIYARGMKIVVSVLLFNYYFYRLVDFLNNHFLYFFFLNKKSCCYCLASVPRYFFMWIRCGETWLRVSYLII